MEKIMVSYIYPCHDMMKSFEFYDLDEVRTFFILMNFPYNNKCKLSTNLKRLNDYLQEKDGSFLFFTVY